MKLIVANWKLNPVKTADALKLAAAISKVKTKHKVVLCPPFVYLSKIKSKFDLGAQDIFWEESGAYTGEISGSMLKELKAKYVIIGHSERRALGESDHEVNLKLQAAIKNKLIPILCVGYGLKQDENEEEVLVHLQGQLQQDLEDIDPKKVIVAYEPVWAIGTDKPVAPDHAERVAMFIRIKFKVAKILYGGGTDAKNFAPFLKKHIDGLLVGHSSIKIDEFKKMLI